MPVTPQTSAGQAVLKIMSDVNNSPNIADLYVDFEAQRLDNRDKEAR